MFYKSQSILFLVVPTQPYEITSFLAGVILLFVFEVPNKLNKLFYVATQVYRQCNIAIFFVDWEKSKTAKHASENSDSSSVSIWRTLFMTNEWCALQTHRRCRIEFTLIGVMVLLNGLNARNLCKLHARFPETDSASGIENAILLFAIDAICWLTLIIAQLSFRYVFYDRYYRNKVKQYADLLSLSNISMFALDEKSHGYYIHGRSVHATADTGMDELNTFLRQEASDICPRRGLNDTDEQDFEIFVSPEWRRQFDKIYTPYSNQGDIARTAGMINRLGTGSTYTGMKPASSAKLVAYKAVKKFLKSFVDLVSYFGTG